MATAVAADRDEDEVFALACRESAALLGARIVVDVLSAEKVAWVRAHHERVDGTGHPDGLSRDAIPSGARILAVADAWDAMTACGPTRRPSRRRPHWRSSAG